MPTMRNQLIPLLLTLLTAFTTLASAAVVDEKSTKPRTRTSSKLAKGVIIAIVVVVVVGIIVLCLIAFCVLRCLRTKKSSKAVVPPVETKPGDVENQNYYAGNNAGYGQQPYDPNANANQYGAHQNEYNAGYNTGYNAPPVGTGYNATGGTPTGGYDANSNAGYYNQQQQQQGYAPPSGPPNMPVPPTGHY